MSLLTTVVLTCLLLVAANGFQVKLHSARVKSYSLSMVSSAPVSPTQDVKKALVGSSIAVLSSLLGAKVALAAGATYLKEPTPEFVDGEETITGVIIRLIGHIAYPL
jgi:hypothetical protein